MRITFNILFFVAVDILRAESCEEDSLKNVFVRQWIVRHGEMAAKIKEQASEISQHKSEKLEMEEEIKCLKNELLKKNDITSLEENNRVAFMLCGVLDTSPNDYNQKFSGERQDNFNHEIEVPKSKNQTLLEELNQVKSKTKDDRETTVAQLKDKLQKVTEDYENLVVAHENKEKSLSNSVQELGTTVAQLKEKLQKVTEDYENLKEKSLSKSVQELEKHLKAKDLELQEEKKKNDLLNKSLEMEKVNAETFKFKKDDMESQLKDIVNKSECGSLENTIKRLLTEIRNQSEKKNLLAFSTRLNNCPMEITFSKQFWRKYDDCSNKTPK